MDQPTPKKKRQWLDYALWAVVAGFVLYRFVLPVPSASLSPELAAARLETDGKPQMVEFTSTRWPACIAMGPVVHQLENAYTGRITFRKFVMDTITPGTADYEDMRRLGALAGFKVTPTVLVIDAEGAVVSKYEGVTSYLTLRRDLETALRSRR